MKKRKDLAALFEKEAWECHRTISRRVRKGMGHVVLDWGSHDRVNRINPMMMSFVVERIVDL